MLFPNLGFVKTLFYLGHSEEGKNLYFSKSTKMQKDNDKIPAYQTTITRFAHREKMEEGSEQKHNAVKEGNKRQEE